MKMYQVNAVKMINTDNLNDELAFETTSIIQQYLNKSQKFWKNKRYWVKIYSDEKIKHVENKNKNWSWSSRPGYKSL